MTQRSLLVDDIPVQELYDMIPESKRPRRVDMTDLPEKFLKIYKTIKLEVDRQREMNVRPSVIYAYFKTMHPFSIPKKMICRILNRPECANEMVEGAVYNEILFKYLCGMDLRPYEGMKVGRKRRKRTQKRPRN
jgi:hypothetical protein